MWGLMLRVTGARVEARIPGWLMNAAASHAVIEHGRRVAHALAAEPDRYGFDPGATYTAFVQSWDRAELNIRSLAFGRNIAGHDAVGLWPDPYYIGSRGFRALRTTAAGAPAWRARSGRFVWRGSVTGAGAFAAPEDIPRIRLALACRGLAETDVGLIGVHPTMAGSIPVATTEHFIADHGLRRKSWPVADFGDHRFAFDIDGHANAWGLLEKLILGCCVLKVASPFEQWYHPRLRPWVHYVPVRADLSDLAQIIDWCRRHDERCEWIARNGARLAASLALEHDLAESCRAFLMVAHPTRSDCAPPQADRHASGTIAYEDAASLAEAQGLLGTAIDACTHLVDAGAGSVPVLHRRSGLRCQQGRFADALGDLEAAVAIDPGDDDALLALAKFLSHVGRDLAAVDCLERILHRTPASAEARIVLAASCIRLDRLDEAFRTVHRLPADVSGWWEDLRRRSIDHHRARREQIRAILRTRRATSVFPIDQAWELAIALHALGRLRSARHLCALTAQQHPASFAPHELTSKIIARSDGPADALAYLAQLSSTFADDPQYVIRQGQLMFEIGDYQQALDLLLGRPDVSNDYLVRRTIAWSSILLDERDALLDHCRAWMTNAPEESLPAELVCATRPLPGAGLGEITVRPAGPPSFRMVQFWRDTDVSTSLRETMDSWSVHHPTVRRHVFHDASARAFLASEFTDEVVQTYDRCLDIATRTSILRYAWLYRHGGVWIAADQRCLRPAMTLLSEFADAAIATVRSGDPGGLLQDVVVGARRGSPVMQAALRATILRATGAEHSRPAQAELLTRVVAAHVCARGEAGDDVVLVAPLQWSRYSVGVRRP